MSAELCTDDFPHDEVYDGIADALESRGYAVVPGMIPPRLAEGLLLRVTDIDSAAFYTAGVGRATDFQQNPFVRNDQICWLNTAHAIEKSYLDWMESLRMALNRRLFLGLFDYECHFARYAPGAFYRKHLDAFKGSTNRKISTVAYLNPSWSAADGGQLLIYDNDGVQDYVTESVQPLMGTLVIFLSDRVPHEVSVARRQRFSIAGWFRVNGSNGGQLDPPR